MSNRVKEFLLPKANSSAPITDEEKKLIIEKILKIDKLHIKMLGLKLHTNVI